ncbi:MAG: hypothetical protein P9L99_14085 [Candidatus Lernaella stagnicola]|nr:hypothetical protein [Candidatus Lernaella stagnicola]
MKTTATILLAVFVLALTAPAWAAKIECEPEFPIRGQEVFVTLSDVEDPTAWSFVVTYRPNSATAQINQLGPPAADGRLRWLPTASGLVEIKAQGPTKDAKVTTNIAVRFPSPPISGIIILLVAGTILFGGAGYSLSKAIRN